MQDRVNIVDVVRGQAGLDRRLAVSRGETSVTYGELLAAAGRLRGFLTEKCGVAKHSRVALLCEDSIEYVITALALLDADAVMVPASPSLSAREFDSLCERMHVNHVIRGQSAESLAKTADISESLSIYAAGKDIEPFGKPVRDPAFIRFSSGTTGMSKGVLLTHAAIIERTNAADERLGITDGDTVGWFLSMSWHFVVTILLFLQRGAHIVLAGDKFPKGAIDAFRRHPPTFMYASPFHYAFLTRSDDFPGELLSRVRMAVSTATALEKTVAEDFAGKFGLGLTQAYGIIEVGLPFINDRTDDAHIDSVGRILPAFRMRLEDTDGHGRGRILLKGRGMYEGYVSPWRERGEWFDTGDIGELKNGYLFIRGRHKNVINYNGMKIFPEEVEQVILRFEGIREARVYGQPHKLYGRLPVAEYVVSDGIEDISLPALRQFLRERLDVYKIPKEFIRTETIGKTLSGKIRRQ